MRSDSGPHSLVCDLAKQIRRVCRLNMTKVLVSRKIMLFRPISRHAGHINGIKIHKHSHSLNSGAVCGHNLNVYNELPDFCVGRFTSMMLEALHGTPVKSYKEDVK